MAITIKDVVQLAGVSPSTVSRTCKNNPSISEETEDSINSYQLGIEAASQMIKHISNPNLMATKILVPHHLVERESCVEVNSKFICTV